MSRRAPIVAQALTAIVVGLFIFVGLVVAWVVGYQLWFAGRVFP
jgi:hypothetical protein